VSHSTRSTEWTNYNPARGGARCWQWAGVITAVLPWRQSWLSQAPPCPQTSACNEIANQAFKAMGANK